MPKLGMEPIRRKALINAAITEIGRVGSLDVTVSQIAKRAGVSSALAYHYFETKDQLFLSAMRHILSVYGAEVRGALCMADTPRKRVEAIVRASFSSGNYKKEVISAWLNFYVVAQRSVDAKRLLNIYQKRVVSNLAYGMRPLVKDDALAVAGQMAALIDGIYLRIGLDKAELDSETAVTMVLSLLECNEHRVQNAT